MSWHMCFCVVLCCGVPCCPSLCPGNEFTSHVPNFGQVRMILTSTPAGSGSVE